MAQRNPGQEIGDLMKTVAEGMKLNIASVNTIRRAMGLKPAPFVRSVHHIEGVTDLAAFLKEAERRKTKEHKPTRIHFHKDGALCNLKCYTILVEAEDA